MISDNDTAIVILEGISMYLRNDEVNQLFVALEKKYANLHILMDVYTEFGAERTEEKETWQTL